MIVWDEPRIDIVTVVGPNDVGLPIEVFVDTTHRDDPVVFHAMPINELRQSELLGG